MRRIPKRAFLAAALLIVSTSIIEAKERARPSFLEDPVVRSASGAITIRLWECQVGNLNLPPWAIPGFLLPPEEYKLVFDPEGTCTACPDGILIDKIHVMLQMAEACTLFMGIDLETVAYPTDPDCPEPGAQLCGSPVYEVWIPGAGLWDIGIPINCPCVAVDDLYLLGLKIERVGSVTPGDVPDLVVDDYPAVCTSWNNYGSGWQDLVATYGFPGQLRFWADATCCGETKAEESSWGRIKKQYR